MAKGNMLQGQATGKVGDIVFMVRNGQQVARVYTSAGGRSGDQASIAVRRQRVRFGAASNQYLLYRNIVRGMYRTGKSTKQSDYNFFVRENVDLLPYLTREENAAGVKCAMPGTFSRGTLGSLTQSFTNSLAAGGTYSVLVTSAGQGVPEPVNWGDTVSKFKDVLKRAYPNARKVTYAVFNVIRQELDLPNGSQYSHQLDRSDVVFDLYEEDPDVADTETVQDYFVAKVGYVPFQLVLAQAPGNIAQGNNLFQFVTDDDSLQEYLPSMLVMVFATNDQVGDCYTTTISAFNVSESDGGLSLYASLRTDDHRQVAEDSYGYATGVMRTNIQQA